MLQDALSKKKKIEIRGFFYYELVEYNVAKGQDLKMVPIFALVMALTLGLATAQDDFWPPLQVNHTVISP